MGWLETTAFTLVIGAQFLAAIFLVTRRHSLYADAKQDAAREDTAVPIGLDRQTR